MTMKKNTARVARMSPIDRSEILATSGIPSFFDGTTFRSSGGKNSQWTDRGIAG
jgi:hypothetical protein